jgi:hypothetical protein
MTLSNEEYPQRFKLTGPGQTLPFHFYVAEASWILVTKYSAGARTDLTLGADYTVVLAGDLRGGWVTLAEDQGAEDDVIVIGLNIPVSQLTDYKFRTAFDQDGLKDSLNKVVQLCRQVDYGILRSLKMPLEVAYAGQGVLRNRKGKVLQGNEDGVLVLRDPIVIFTDEIRDLEATSGDIPVSYASMVTLTPDTPCQATMALEIYLLWDPSDGSPSDDQKTLNITLVQDGNAGTVESAGFQIGPGDWVSGGTGKLVHTRSFPIYFLPDEGDEILIWSGVNIDPYEGHSLYAGSDTIAAVSVYYSKKEGYGIELEMSLTAGTFPGAEPGQYNGFGVYDVANPAPAEPYAGSAPITGGNPDGSRNLEVGHRAAFQAGGTLTNWIYNPASVAGNAFMAYFSGYGYQFRAADSDMALITPQGACSGVGAASWGVFVSGPYFDTYASEIAGHGLTDIGATGQKGYELTPTVVE